MSPNSRRISCSMKDTSLLREEQFTTFSLKCKPPDSEEPGGFENRSNQDFTVAFLMPNNTAMVSTAPISRQMTAFCTKPAMM